TVTHMNRTLADSAADFVVFDARVCQAVGLSPPFSRQVGVSSAGGPVNFTLPDDGTFGLFVTDYTEFCYLPITPVGFWTGPGPNVVGRTGFLHHFDVRLRRGLSPPEVELDPLPGFPGIHGVFAPVGSLRDFIRSIDTGP